MRRVAGELDTGASGLYVYVRNRDDLLEAMFGQAMAGVATDGLPAAASRAALGLLALFVTGAAWTGCRWARPSSTRSGCAGRST